MRTQRLGDVEEISDYSPTTPRGIKTISLFLFGFTDFFLFSFFLSFLLSFPAILPSFRHLLQGFYTPRTVAGKRKPLFTK
jgi:hypothetical protein